MADSLPSTPTDSEYRRGIEDFRKDIVERKDLHSIRQNKMRSTSRSPTRRRSRSPIRRRSRSPRRDDRRGGRRTIRDKECRVYVSNLNYDTKWMELKDVMKRKEGSLYIQVATVEHVEVLTDGAGRSKGCAIVEYGNSDDAARAIKDLDGHELLGRKLRMREDNVDDETYREQLKTQKDKTKQLKEQQQWEHHPQGMHNMGQNPLNALGALGGLGGVGGGGFTGLSALLGAQTAQIQILTMLNSKGGDTINSSVFVSNLEYECNWQKLKDMFKRAGHCIRCDIAEDDSRKSKGFGSAQFETPMEALTAVAMFNGIEIGPSRRQIIVRLDRNASLHQALAQLGINSKEVTQQTLVQIQSLATIAALGGSAGGLGGLGGIGGLGLQGLGALGGLGALQQQQAALQQQQVSALSNLQTSQGNTNATGLNLSNLASLGLGGLGNLLGATGANNLQSNLQNNLQNNLQSNLQSNLQNNALSAFTNSGSTGSAMGGSSAYGTSSSPYGSQSTANYGNDRRDDNRRNSDSGRGYSSSNDNSVNSRVFVRNLPFSVNWQELKDKFRDAGPVVRADVKTGDDGRSKGYAVVTFESPSQANKAVALFNGCRLQGREIEVRIDRS